MMTPNQGILTTVLTQFLTVFKAGFGYIQPDSYALIGTIGTIDLILAALFWAMKSEDFTAAFIKKILIAGLIIYFVQNWQSLINTLVSGFVYVGIKAGGGVGVPALTDPSAIINYAFSVTAPLETEITNIEVASWIHLTGESLFLRFCNLLILGACAII